MHKIHCLHRSNTVTNLHLAGAVVGLGGAATRAAAPEADRPTSWLTAQRLNEKRHEQKRLAMADANL